MKVLLSIALVLATASISDAGRYGRRVYRTGPVRHTVTHSRVVGRYGGSVGQATYSSGGSVGQTTVVESSGSYGGTGSYGGAGSVGGRGVFMYRGRPYRSVVVERYGPRRHVVRSRSVGCPNCVQSAPMPVESKAPINTQEAPPEPPADQGAANGCRNPDCDCVNCQCGPDCQCGLVAKIERENPCLAGISQRQPIYLADAPRVALIRSLEQSTRMAAPIYVASI